MFCSSCWCTHAHRGDVHSLAPEPRSSSQRRYVPVRLEQRVGGRGGEAKAPPEPMPMTPLSGSMTSPVPVQANPRLLMQKLTRRAKASTAGGRSSWIEPYYAPR